jgi:hypothetical protein
MQIDGKSVSVATARVGPVEGRAKGDYLSLTVRITNRTRKPILHQSWARKGIGVILRDLNGRYYIAMPAVEPADKAIAPGETYPEMLVFEATPPGASLDLDLPASEGAAPFQFRLRSLFIELPRPNAPAPKVATPKAAPPPAPTAPEPSTAPEATVATIAKAKAPEAPPAVDPEKDPKLRAKIVSEFKEGKRRIDRRAMGMNTNDAVSFKRNAPKELLKSLAKKHNLELDEVRRIVGVD